MKPVRMQLAICFVTALAAAASSYGDDAIRTLQNQAVDRNQSDVAHWGTDPANYTQWGSHSARLIPVYTFGTRDRGAGIDLGSYTGANSLYRSEARVRELYRSVPEQTVNSRALYCDQTEVALLQRAAVDSGQKKHVILIVFDGMDWQTTRAASIARLGRVAYDEGRGTGLHFLDYGAHNTAQFGYMVTAPLTGGASADVDEQTVKVDLSQGRGGYAAALGGQFPWSQPEDVAYLIGKSKVLRHAYADSAGSASSMCSGIKTYNGSINIDAGGQQAVTVAHLAQEKGWAVGAVSSVPISHATPAAAYAHNVSRNDYQDLSRDLLGLRSVSHPETPLPGLDVLIGGGFGQERTKDSGQGKNFVPGNAYLAEEDILKLKNHVVVRRESGVDGHTALAAAAVRARDEKKRLLGVYGLADYKGHLPFQTANGDFIPAMGRRKKAEKYSSADLSENPTLAEMTSAALQVLSADPDGFWLMVEAGDVDWANHDDNLDNSIGAVFSGDRAVKVVTDWVERNSNWDESLLIVTADHGHYLFLDDPERLAAAARRTTTKPPVGSPTVPAK